MRIAITAVRLADKAKAREKRRINKNTDARWRHTKPTKKASVSTQIACRVTPVFMINNNAIVYPKRRDGKSRPVAHPNMRNEKIMKFSWMGIKYEMSENSQWVSRIMDEYPTPRMALKYR
jgi:hypothetical protein